MIRSFVALDIPQTAKNEFSDLISFLKESRADVRWARAENLHLTLRFLGETTQEQADSIKGSLREIAAGEKSFSIHFAGLGAFPTLQRPRLFWAGIDQGAEFLERLAERIDLAAAAIGFQREERAFSPHMTLGRVRSPRNLQELIHRIRQTEFTPAEKIPMERLTLYKSTLGREGPVYEIIERFDFSR